MDHPNIAKVLDAGATPTVARISSWNWCAASRSSSTVITAQRLAILVPLCRAVQHAHQKGVIHRDLTPPNVLVSEEDGRPVAKVIDFGIAKAVGASLTEETLITRAGQPIGTPAVMSSPTSSL